LDDLESIMRSKYDFLSYWYSYAR